MYCMVISADEYLYKECFSVVEARKYAKEIAKLDDFGAASIYRMNRDGSVGAFYERVQA